MNKTELERMLVEGLQVADEAVQQHWARIQIPPERWSCAPWGDASGGFWVVAIDGNRAIWYNEIEDGFNDSGFDRVGTIRDYGCEQLSFTEFLLTRLVSQNSENFAEEAPSLEIPTDLSEPGTIVRRQTTFWELRSSLGTLWRVHFTDKIEARFVSPYYQKLCFESEHPLLRHFSHQWAQLYISRPSPDPEKLLAELADRIYQISDGWRHHDEYLNPAVRDVLKSGRGLVLTGPEEICDAVKSLLDHAGLSPSTIGPSAPPNTFPKLLLFGKETAIAAKAFRFQAELAAV